MLMMRILLLLLILIPMAYGQSQEAVSSYMTGDYAKAARLGESGDNADAVAFAARAILAEGMSQAIGEPSKGALTRAEALARRALVLDEAHVEARLQLAISLSLQARPMSNRQVMRSGFGAQAKDLAQSIIEDDPENAYAHALLAVWNVEVLRRGGRLGGRIMGASVEEGRAHYNAAARVLPGDGALHWQWARVLASTNVKKYRPEIEMVLEASISASTDDVLEGVMQARAKRLLDVLRTGTDDEAKALAAALL